MDPLDRMELWVSRMAMETVVKVSMKYYEFYASSIEKEEIDTAISDIAHAVEDACEDPLV